MIVSNLKQKLIFVKTKSKLINLKQVLFVNIPLVQLKYLQGQFCQHQQCFSLNNFLDMMIHAEHLKWICPICKKNCISLKIDQYQWEILKKIQQLNIKVDYITVDQNGSLDFKDPLYAIIQNNKINNYSDLISQGCSHFERSCPQFDNDNEILSQKKFHPQGENELNSILID